MASTLAQTILQQMGGNKFLVMTGCKDLVWDEKNSTPLLEKTDLSGRPGNEYLIRDEEGIRRAVSNAEANGYVFFSLVTDEGCTLDGGAVLDCLARAMHGSFSYGWNEYMRTMTVLYGV